jgi:hypothetical protein
MDYCAAGLKEYHAGQQRAQARRAAQFDNKE